MSGPKGPKPGAVGYGRPPVVHRFQKGRSGNPKGRPPKVPRPTAGTPSGELASLLLKEAYRPVRITENGKTEEVPVIQAIYRKMALDAAQGDHRARLIVTALVRDAERGALDERAATFTFAVEYKARTKREFEAADRAGQPRPERIPHPDDIVVDLQTGIVYLNGPADASEKAEWAEQQALKKTAREDAAEYTAELKRRRSKIARDVLKRLIAHAEDTEALAKMFPDEQTRRRPGLRLDEFRRNQLKRRK